jgi:hypothetical protein
MSTVTAKAEPKGYRSHKPGSRKGKVHELFDKQGPDAAWTLGLKLKLKEGTLRSWFSSWSKAKPAPKATPKKNKPTSKKTSETKPINTAAAS